MRRIATILALTAGFAVSGARAAGAGSGVDASVGVDAGVDASAGAGCAVWDATYALAGTLRISDTPMGAGDGVHAVGPGLMVLRFDDAGDGGPGRVELRSFELLEHFSLEPQSFLVSARIVTHVMARAAADESGVIASGTVEGDAIHWDTPLRGYHTDGALECTGSLCGNFGAPAPGRTELHSAPRPVKLAPFRFKASGLTFQMPFVLVSQDRSPPQKGSLALSGRAKSWVCAQPR